MTEPIETQLNTIEELLAVGAHYGYSKTRRHPSVNSYIFTTKNKIDILDVEKTTSQLDSALAFVEDLAKSGKILLVIGTKPEARKAITEHVAMWDIPFVKERWIGGAITNFSEIKKRIARLMELKEMEEKGELEKYNKREKLDFTRETEKLEKNFGGIATLNKAPDAVFIIDPEHEMTALREAKEINIPIIALANSDCNILNVTYPILANDSAQKSIDYFIRKITETYRKNYQIPEKKESVE